MSIKKEIRGVINNPSAHCTESPLTFQWNKIMNITFMAEAGIQIQVQLSQQLI